MGPFAVVRLMKEIGSGRRVIRPETMLAKHLAEQSFLRRRCNAGFLTSDQTVTILSHVDYLESECRALRWLLGLPERETGDTLETAVAAHHTACVI